MFDDPTVGAEIQKRVDLGQDVALVLGQVGTDLAKLVGQHQDERRHQRPCGDDGDDDRSQVSETQAAQVIDQRRQDEGEEHPQRQRQEKVLRDIQDGADHGDGRQSGQRYDGMAGVRPQVFTIPPRGGGVFGFRHPVPHPSTCTAL